MKKKNNISLGKGKRVEDDEVIEKVKLKPTVKEEQPGEESVVETPKEAAEIKTTDKEEKTEPQYQLKPLDKFESEPEKAPLEDVKKYDDEKEPKPPKEEKPKKVKKVKAEPIPEMSKQPLKLGEPKEPDEAPDEDIKLQYKQKPLPEEPTEEVVLKALKKDKKETDQLEEEIVHDIKLAKKQPTESPEVDEESAKIKLKKKKTKTPKGEEEAAMDVVLSLKKPTKKQESEDEEQFTLAKIPLKSDQIEDVEAQVSLKPKKTTHGVDEAAEGLTITLAPEQPEEQQDEVVLTFKQPIDEVKPEDDEESAVFTIEKPAEAPLPADVAEKLKIKKKKSKKEVAADELSISQEIVIEPEPITIEEMVEDIQIVEKPVESIDQPDLLEYPAEETVEQIDTPIEQPVEITEEIEKPEPVAKHVEERDDVTIKKKKKKQTAPEQTVEEITEDLTLKKPSVDQPHAEQEQEDVVLKLKKPADQAVDESEEQAVFTIGKKKEKDSEGPTTEDVSEKLKIKKKKSKKQAAADELSITKEIVLEPEPIMVEEIVEDVQMVEKPVEEMEEYEPKKTEDTIEEVTLDGKQPDEKPTDEIAEDITLKKPKEDKKELDEEQVTIKKSKKKKPKADEVEATVTLKPDIEQTTEDVQQAVTVKKRKEVKFAEIDTAETVKIEGKPESDNEAEFTISKRTDKPQTEDIETEVTIRKEDDEEEEDVVSAEFTVKKKKEPKPAVEEHNDEYTIKKLKKRRRSQVEIPEYTDVEHVTFRPRSTKTKEDVEQEFNIQLDSYAEEEISMSGKVKLKKTKVPTYSEDGDEMHIKVTEKYDDKEGPIIEEIDDDVSAAEDTMYDIDEPEEFSDIEELPEHVEFKLKPKKTKPAYVVEDLDEEFAVGFTHRKRPDAAVSYGEDSFTLRTPSRRLPSSYLEGMNHKWLYLVFFFFLI